MKPVADWTVADLEALIGVEESSNLEFKDGRSLLNEPEKKKEIAKDVSAMANAAGGTIVYGLHERDSIATEIVGCDASHGKAEWFDQIITSNIEPKVQGVQVKRIDLPNGRLALLVEVPQATNFAPHQSKPHCQYFRRYNTTIQPMLDHEVRDLMRRSSAPELYLRWAILPAGGNRDLFSLHVFYGNMAKEPALYSQVELIFEDSVAPIHPDAGWQMSNLHIQDVGQGKVYKRQFMVPNHMPIMTEREQEIFRSEMILGENMVYTLGFQISAPGFFKALLFSASRFGTELKVHLEPASLSRRPK
ncbi:helix-turn-helix domain-containing protein [Brevundimonas sp. UBA7664]|uniref:AlbA family DNA-binding domain-containing protein n=1 Tax=Brevundimonas sp. UBA7664 TaxID=1946141 RepID=UPI0025B82382|nr:ATP-binding protein [Brevundimonas sp. UBA7664]